MSLAEYTRERFYYIALHVSPACGLLSLRSWFPTSWEGAVVEGRPLVLCPVKVLSG